MDELVELWERPFGEEKVMIAGWRQWADAGSVSSAFPEYLVRQTNAVKIGHIKPDGFYIFQIPGMHHLLRPDVKLEQGYRKHLTSPANEIFHADVGDRGLVIFLGEEPHLNVERYADAFFDVIQQLDVRRVALVGGVYGAMPYDKEREISCIYSLPEMKDDLAELAIKFSDYEGGSTIGTYLVDAAEERGVEMVDFYAFVPAYDFSEVSALLQGVRVESDFKAWHDLMKRINHLFDLDVDLSDLERQSRELVSTMDAKMEELEEKIPHFDIREYLDELDEDFHEQSFMPLDEVWKRELGDILEDFDD